jgi:RNA polymerase sigma factor (sigma-70 family)
VAFWNCWLNTQIKFQNSRGFSSNTWKGGGCALGQQGNTDIQDSVHSGAPESEHRARIERLFREHHEALMRFLRARFPVQEAREAAQEAFTRLLSVDSGAISYLRTFLFRSATNIAIDRHRRHEAEGRARSELPLVMWSEMADMLSPERRVSSEQTLRELERAIEEMPPKCREAFVMHQIDGMGFPEIAEHMQLGESMVRKYVAKGLLHCRARLEKEPSNAR